MTKSLSEIQKENRRFILEAIHGCSYEEAVKIEKQEIKSLTLSRVLLASIKSEKCMDCFEHKNNKYCNSGWHEADSKENLSRIRDFILDNWKNLKLETLEEQTEETQRRLNELFNN